MYLTFGAILALLTFQGLVEDISTRTVRSKTEALEGPDVPKFVLLHNFDDHQDPKTNIPQIEVHFANGVRDVMKLEHINHMPNSRNVQSSKLCNYLGSLTNDEKNSVVAVTGCLNKRAPDEKMLITMFSENSPFHRYFSLDVDGKVQAIRPKTGGSEFIRPETKRNQNKKSIEIDSNQKGAWKDIIVDEEVEKQAGRMGDVRNSVPDVLKVNFRFGVDTSAKSGIENTLSLTVDNYLSDLLTHTQAHYMLPSLQRTVKFEVTKPTYEYDGLLIVNQDPIGLDKTVELVQMLNEKDVDLYAWITDTRDDSGTTGVAYLGGACDNSKWMKTSINAGVTIDPVGGILALANTLSHEVGHNLGMSHDFEGAYGGEPDKLCRKHTDGSILNCVQCDNFFNASYAYGPNPAYTSYRKLSPATGTSANECCTGIMDYGNAPSMWSTCSARYLEQHYVSEGWFQCMSENPPCIEQCCDTIELSSTTNAGHPGLGTYTKKPYDNDGRAVYYNGWGYVYWRSDVNMWSIGSSAGNSASYAKNEDCVGENGFCPTGCSSGWQFYKNPWELDETMEVKCVGDPPTVTCGGNTTDPATTPNPIPTTSKDSQNDIENEGKGCWDDCNAVQGPCEWCGKLGMCCTMKPGWTDTSNGCDGTFGGATSHECALKPTPGNGTTPPGPTVKPTTNKPDDTTKPGDDDCMDKFKLKVTQGYYTNGYVDQGAMALDKCACSCAKKESCIAFGWRDTFSTWNPEHCYFWENKADLNETVTDSMVNTYIKMGDLECTDDEADCSKWAEVGECQKNPTFMLKSCKKSCDQCECKDKFHNCYDFKDQCHDAIVDPDSKYHLERVKEVCKATCGFCGGFTGKPTDKPPTGGPTNKPPTGGPTNKPPTGGPTNKPPTGGPTNKPPTGGPTNKPPTGGPTNKPPTGEPTNKPPTGGPTNKPPTGYPTDKPPTGKPGTCDWQMCSGYCYTQYFIDNYFTVDLYADTIEECKKHCENKGPEKCNGFKLGSDATGMVCKGTPMKKSVIKDHLVACTSPDCGECDPTVQSKWEYWSCGSGDDGNTTYPPYPTGKPTTSNPGELDCMDKFKWSTKGYYKNGWVDQGPKDTIDHCACACAKADQHKCVAFGYRDPLSTVAPKHCYFYEDVADLKEIVQDDEANTYIKIEQECNDEEADCSKWAEVGECQKNPTYMLKSCKKSCNACGTPEPPTDKPEPPKPTTPKPKPTTTKPKPKPVNGRWSNWGPFTKCTKTCGGGIRKRTRRCNNPAPKNGGKTCPGAAIQQQRCNIKACPKPCGVDKYPKNYKCRSTHTCAKLAVRKGCNKRFSQMVPKWCNLKLAVKDRRAVVKNYCKRSCKNCKG